MTTETIRVNDLQKEAIEASRENMETQKAAYEVAHQRFLDFFAGVLFAADIKGGQFVSLEGTELKYLPNG